MTISLLFWVIYIIVLIFGGVGWTRGERPSWSIGGLALTLYILIGLVGYRVFGSPIRD